MVSLQSLNCRRSAASLNACTKVTATFQEPKQPQKITVWNFVSTLFATADMSTGSEGYFFVCLLFVFPYIVMNKKGEFWDQNWGLCCDPQNHIRAGVGWDTFKQVCLSLCIWCMSCCCTRKQRHPQDETKDYQGNALKHLSLSLAWPGQKVVVWVR